MADSELKRMISRYEEELMRYASRHNSGGTAGTNSAANKGQTGGSLRPEEKIGGNMEQREQAARQGQAMQKEQFAFGERNSAHDPTLYDEHTEKSAVRNERTTANGAVSDGMEPLDKSQMHRRFEYDMGDGAKPLFATEMSTAQTERSSAFTFGEEEREDYEPEEDSVILPNDRFERDSELQPDGDFGTNGTQADLDMEMNSDLNMTDTQINTAPQTNGEFQLNTGPQTDNTYQQNMRDAREDNSWRNTDNAARSAFTGYLEVTARTGEEALPVEGALIIVTSTDENGERLEYTAITDRSGSARIFDLPASNPANTESPGHTDRYYLYDVSISKPGYFDMTSRGIPLFGGVTSRQDFKMVPLPENLPQGDIEISNTESQELE